MAAGSTVSDTNAITTNALNRLAWTKTVLEKKQATDEMRKQVRNEAKRCPTVMQLCGVKVQAMFCTDRFVKVGGQSSCAECDTHRRNEQQQKECDLYTDPWPESITSFAFEDQLAGQTGLLAEPSFRQRQCSEGQQKRKLRTQCDGEPAQQIAGGLLHPQSL
jgi:hypothetical protein